MTATFSNSRLSSLPCERMRGSLIFSDDFVSDGRVEENHGTISGAVIARGATFSGSDSIIYNALVHGDDLSLVFKFNTSESGELFSNASATAGFDISVSDSAVTVTFYDGTTHAVSIDANVLDGLDHTLTLSISNGTMTVYIDDNDGVVNSSYLVVSTEDIVIGSTFAGVIYSIRVFNDALAEDDHLNYYNNTLSSFMKNAIATYRCDSIGNDTDGNKIWDKQPTVNDLYKGDKSTTSTFPTFDTDKYSFDYIDDYISNVPTLPDEYTVSAVTQSPYALTSDIRQENDSTLLTELKTAGSYHGYIRNLILHTGILTAFQLLHSEYQQLYHIARGYAAGIYARLIVEGTGKLMMVLSKSFFNWGFGGAGVGTGITIESDGVTFDNTASNITVADNEELRLTQGTIIVFGEFDGSTASRSGLVFKDGDYQFSINNSSIKLNGSKYSLILSNNKQLAVTFKSGFQPMFYLDGEFLGAGDTVETIDDSGIADVIIGNIATLDANSPHKINHVYIGDEPLTDCEILAMFNQSKVTITDPEFTSLQSTVDGDILLQSTVDGDPILQSTVI